MKCARYRCHIRRRAPWVICTRGAPKPSHWASSNMIQQSVPDSLMAAALHTDHIERERERRERCGWLRQHARYQSLAFLHSVAAGPFRGHVQHNGFSTAILVAFFLPSIWALGREKPLSGETPRALHQPCSHVPRSPLFFFFSPAFCVDRNIAIGGALFVRPRRQPVESRGGGWGGLSRGWGGGGGGCDNVQTVLWDLIHRRGQIQRTQTIFTRFGSLKRPINDKTENAGGVLRRHATASRTSPLPDPPRYPHAVRLTSTQPYRPARTSLCSSNKRSKDGAREKKFTAERFMSVRARRYGCRTCMERGGVAGVRGDAVDHKGRQNACCGPGAVWSSLTAVLKGAEPDANFAEHCNGPAVRMTNSPP